MHTINITEQQRMALIAAVAFTISMTDDEIASRKAFGEICDLLINSKKSIPEPEKPTEDWRSKCTIHYGSNNGYFYVNSPCGKYWLGRNGSWKSYNEFDGSNDLGNFNNRQYAETTLANAVQPPA